MSEPVNPADLRGIPLLNGLDEFELAELISHCEVAHCPPETVIVRQGEEEQTLFILLDGSAEVLLDVPHVGDETIAELPAPSTFGEVSFFHPAPHTATVKCVAASRLLRLRRAKFEQLRFENNRTALKIGCNAAAVLAERLQTTDAWIAEQMQSAEDRRIHESWVRFRERIGRQPTTVSGGFVVT